MTTIENAGEEMDVDGGGKNIFCITCEESVSLRRSEKII